MVKRRKNFLLFEEAKKFVISLKLKNNASWKKYNKPNCIPARPNIVYKTEWVSWDDWLGNKNISLLDLRKLLAENNINTKPKYLKFYKSNMLASNPIKHYKLSSWRELFNADYKKAEYLTYENAKFIVHKFKLRNQQSWYSLCKENLIPNNIPKTPNKYYKEWISWNEWLGHSITSYKKFLTYEEAKKHIKELNLSSLCEYYDYLISNNIDFLPLNPIVSYGKDYVSSFDFLNKDNSRLSYGEKKIKDYLIRNNISFEQEFQFDDCINKKKLLFDFYIFDRKILIEFDGKQHFEPIKYFGGIEGYNYRKKNDIIKNIYCIENKIELIRISYEDINIVDKILDKYLH